MSRPDGLTFKIRIRPRITFVPHFSSFIHFQKAPFSCKSCAISPKRADRCCVAQTYWRARIFRSPISDKIPPDRWLTNKWCVPIGIHGSSLRRISLWFGPGLGHDTFYPRPPIQWSMCAVLNECRLFSNVPLQFDWNHGSALGWLAYDHS